MLKKLGELFSNKSVNKTFFTLVFVLVGVLLFYKTVNATAIIEAIADPLGFFSNVLLALFLIITKFLGVLFVFFVGILIDIAKFNDFITMPMVIEGWGLVRDIANMFFIVILLVIAFSTVLKISSYHYQKTLTKLLIMAILVNFSKLICGFLIDFFQVIMLTFVNGFKDVAGGNLAQGFGLYEMLSQAPGYQDTSGWQGGFVAAGALAVVMILVADMVILIMIAVLLWRVAMLWVLVIVSPLAYLSYAIMPKYWSQWWQMFFQNLVSGPVIAFFLWLALLTMQRGEIANQFQTTGTQELQNEFLNVIPSNVTQSVLLNYMVVMALLLGGLTIAQKVAAQSGGAVGSFAQKVQKIGTRAAMIGTGAAAAGWLATKGLPQAYDWGARKVAKGTKGRSDILLRPIRTFRKLREGQKHMAELENLEIEAEAGKVLEKGGAQALIFGAASKDFAYNLHGFLGAKGMYGIVKGKAQTARSIAADIEKKKEDQQKHMEMVNRPDADQYYLNQLQNKSSEEEGKKNNYLNRFNNFEGGIKENRLEAKRLLEQAKKTDDETLKNELISQADEKDKEADKLARSQERRGLAVHALGYDEAIKRGIVDESERDKIKNEDGEIISNSDTAAQRYLSANKLYKDKKELDEKAKKGDKNAREELLKNSKEYLENEYKKVQEKKNMLEAGGYNDSDKEAAKNKVDENNEKLDKIGRDLLIITDPQQIAELKNIQSQLKAENEKLNSLIKATTASQVNEAIKKYKISPDENKKIVDKNSLEIKSLDLELSKLDGLVKKPILNEIDRNNSKAEADRVGTEIGKLEEKLKKIGSYIPQAYYSRQAGRSAMMEEMRKIDTSNEDELIALYNNALRTKNNSKSAAVVMAATKVGHLNEIIQSQRASKDIYADDGKTILAKAGEYFDSSVEGIHAFIKDNFVNKLGMSKQVAYGYENDYSDMAQEVGHWTFAQTMGVENGQFVQRSRDDQQKAVSIEKSKQDFENLMRRVNRLGWTTERWVDRKDPSKGRTTILNEEGIEAIRTNFVAITKSIGKERFNPNLALNLTTKYNMEVLDNIGRSLPEGEKQQWRDFMDSLLRFVNKSRKEAMSDLSVGEAQTKKLDLAKEIRKNTNINF